MKRIIREINRFKILFLIMISLISKNIIAQSDSLKVNQQRSFLMKRKGILVGANISNYPTIEIGYATFFHQYDDDKIPIASGYSFSFENHFDTNYYLVPKISFWGGVLFANYGVSTPWYVNFKGQNSLQLRPEIGIGFKNWNVNFAYNFPIYENDFENIPKPMLTLNYILPFKKN